jgi:hypothetical protein
MDYLESLCGCCNRHNNHRRPERMAATAAMLIEVEVTGTVMPWKKEVGGGVWATTRQLAMTTTDNTHNNQTE